jgi:hypothetical protein
VRYDNFSSETVILPDFAAWITRMSVEGQEGATILRNARVPGLVNIERVRAMSAPDETRDFYILPPGGDAGPVLSVMETDSYSRWQEGVAVPVVHGASGIDLRGRMIEITMTRDHRSLPPDLVTTLNERWPDYGTVWIGIVESQSMRFWIPPEPLALDCTTP